MPTSPRPNSLQQAASAVFAVTTVVPLLIFVWTLHRLGSLSRLQSQVELGFALVTALLGYYIFRRLMGQMSELIRGLGRVVDRGGRSESDGRLSSTAQERAPGLSTEYKPPAVGAGSVPQPALAASAPRPAPSQSRSATVPSPAPVANTAPALEYVAPCSDNVHGLRRVMQF